MFQNVQTFSEMFKNFKEVHEMFCKFQDKIRTFQKSQKYCLQYFCFKCEKFRRKKKVLNFYKRLENYTKNLNWSKMYKHYFPPANSATLWDFTANEVM